jgi:hypothetical protein
MARKSDPRRRKKMRAYAPGHVRNKTKARKAKRTS